jgi:fibro-slime domain-containing protein
MKPKEKKSGNREKGQVLLFSLVLIFGISAMGMYMVLSAGSNTSGLINLKNKTQAFYASDGVMTVLAQEFHDGNKNRYLPAFEKDIGSPPTNPLVGSDVAYNGGKTHVIQGGGDDIWNKDDAFHYTYCELNLDTFTVQIRVDSLKNTNGWAKVGIMIRADTTPGSVHTTNFMSASHGVSRQTRYNDGDVTSSNDNGSGSFPIYLKVSRKGVDFYSYYSSDGSSWTQYSHIQVSMATSVYAGIAVCSHDSTVLTRAGISNISGMDLSCTDTIPWLVGDSVGGALVGWSAQSIPGGGMNIATTGYKLNPFGGKMCSAPLSQSITPQIKTPFYPDIVWVRVIYYDYPSAAEPFPDFYPDNYCYDFGLTLHLGIVRADSLGSDTANASWFGMYTISKPLQGDPAHMCFSWGLDRWFRPFPQLAYDKTVSGVTHNIWLPHYNCEGQLASLDSANPQTSTVYDNIWLNGVVKDSLPLLDTIVNGIHSYYLDSTGTESQPGFCPLDGKGLGNDINWCQGGPHNFSFAMELHHTFVYEKGLTFHFNGDDDVWVFVNNKLVLDLGGLHHEKDSTISLDKVTSGLQIGKTYMFDMFYCERHPCGSDLFIMTNIEFFTVKASTRMWSHSYGNLN